MNERPITLPGADVSPGDLLDQALDKLRTIHLALCPEAKTWLDDAYLAAIWATLDGAIRDIEPVRNRLQLADDGGAQ